MASDVAVIAPGGDRRAATWLGRGTIHTAIFLTLIVVWELGSRAGLINPIMLPPPSGILVSFWRIMFIQGNLWPNLYATMWEVLAGFVAGASLGIALAIPVALSPVVSRLLTPYVVVLEATPRIAMAPLILAALGFGWESKIAIVMLASFFPPFINTVAGILSTDSAKLEMFRSLRASRLQIFTRLTLPDAAPVMLAGLRLGMTSALSGALVAEFISANQGMGVMLKQYTALLNMSSAFAALLTLTAVGLLLFRGMEFLDTRLIFWQSSDGMARVSERRRQRFLKALGDAR